MTTLVSWVGVSTGRPQSLYIASDSRITWASRGGSPERWDLGRKVFATRATPNIFGYCGDVAFPSMLLGQAADLLDSGALFSACEAPTAKEAALHGFLERGLAEYPDTYRQDFTVLYGTRTGERGSNGEPFALHLFVLAWSKTSGWSRSEVPLPSKSGILRIDGSGTRALRASEHRWQLSDAAGTSRATYSALCDSLISGADTRSGGAPQVVRIYPKGPAAPVGVIWNEARYLFAHRLDGPPAVKLEWRNEIFEVCDPVTMKRSPKAQPQPRPRGA